MDAIYQSRLEGLTDEIDYYMWMHHDKGTLSVAQQKHLRELCETVCVFGEQGKQWHDMGMQILTELKAA